MGAGLHHAAFHYGENELRELSEVGSSGEAMSGIIEAAADSCGPSIEVRGDLVVDFASSRIDFEREASDRASESEMCHENLLPVAVEQKKNALNGVFGRRVHGVNEDGLKIGEIPIENRVQHVFFALKEKVEAPTIRASLLEELRHTRGFVSLGVKQFDSGKDDAVARAGGGIRH